MSINAAEMPITLFPAILLHRIIIGRPGLESLFGYLHLTGAEERLEELFEIVMHTGETPAEE